MKNDASSFLDIANKTISDRAASRDTDSERSMKKAVEAFNSLYGTSLTETQGWQFMSILKKARASQGSYTKDDYIDDVAYTALAAESESKLKEFPSKNIQIEGVLTQMYLDSKEAEKAKVPRYIDDEQY